MEIFALIFWLALSFAAAAYAGSKGRSGVGFFFLALFLSPLIAFIWIAVAPSDPQRMGLRKCPQCAEWVKSEALKCLFCSFDFVTPTAPAIEDAPPIRPPAVVATEAAQEPSLKWLWIAGAAVVFGLMVFWSVQFGSTQAAKANEDSAIASMRTVATACLVYQSAYSHGYPAKLAFLGPPAAGARAGDFGADLVGSDLASGTKDGYVFEYRAGRQVRGEIVGYKVIARPVDGGRRSFYLDETAVIRSSVSEPDRNSNPL